MKKTPTNDQMNPHLREHKKKRKKYEFYEQHFLFSLAKFLTKLHHRSLVVEYDKRRIFQIEIVIWNL